MPPLSNPYPTMPIQAALVPVSLPSSAIPGLWEMVKDLAAHWGHLCPIPAQETRADFGSESGRPDVVMPRPGNLRGG